MILLIVSIATAAVLVLAAVLIVARRSTAETPAPAAPVEPKISRIILRRVIAYREPIEESIANRSPLSTALVMAVIAKESSGRPNLPGKDGELGLMQIKDIALQDYNAVHAIDYEYGHLGISGVNIEVGTWYLWQRFRVWGNLRDALRAYNKGDGGARADANAGADYADSILEVYEPDFRRLLAGDFGNVV